jgi:hypothetical protein
MTHFNNGAHALRVLKEQGIIWLTIVDVMPEQNGKDIFIWDCTATLDMSEKGRSWKDATLLDSPNGHSILEDALSISPTNQIYFNNHIIQRK